MEINEIKSLIASGKLEEAIGLLMTEAKDTNVENQIFSLSGRYETIKSQQLKGIISQQDYTLEINKIINDSLEISVLLEKAKEQLNDDATEITYIPELILSLEGNKHTLEFSNEILQLTFKEIWENINEENEPYFYVK